MNGGHLDQVYPDTVHRLSATGDQQALLVVSKEGNFCEDYLIGLVLESWERLRIQRGFRAGTNASRAADVSRREPCAGVADWVFSCAARRQRGLRSYIQCSE
jgi:hypothetical protein